MKSQTISLLTGMLACIILGYFTYPLFQAKDQSPIIARTATSSDQAEESVDGEDTYVPPPPLIIDMVGSVDGSEFGSNEELNTFGDEDEIAGSEDPYEDPVFDINDPHLPNDNEVEELVVIEAEEDVPYDKAQDRVSPVLSVKLINKLKVYGRSIGNDYDQQYKLDRYKRVAEFTAERWRNPDEIKKIVTDRVIAKLGNMQTERLVEYLKAESHRRDLAILTMIRLTGKDALKTISSSHPGRLVLARISGDIYALDGLLYSGPTDNFPQVMLSLNTLSKRYGEFLQADMALSIAIAGALEFAREGWSTELLAERFSFFARSHAEGRLNVRFDTLNYNEKRFIMGASQPGAWGSVKNLAWLQNNVRLPAEQYTGAAYQIAYRLRNIAGDSIFGSAYLAPFMKYHNGVLAHAHRTVGGVCGALSHYGTFAAIANGIPAATMGEPGHCAYAVNNNGTWQRANSLYWQHSLHKTFWREHSWDFLILTQRLYSEHGRTLLASQLDAMGALLASRGKKLGAFRAYEAAIVAQPLHWQAWLNYTGYLKKYAPEDKAKWHQLTVFINKGLNQEFHNAAATLLTKYIYPNFLIAEKDYKQRIKVFSSFFKECKTMGHSRWDVNGILNAQLKAFTTVEEQIDFMQQALSALMRNPDYSGAGVSWGLQFISALPDEVRSTKKCPKGRTIKTTHDKFSDVIILALNRTSIHKNARDNTWETLGLAIFTAGSEKDRRMFQAIGKLAWKKCKKNFPENKFRFRGYRGKLVSTTGLITTDKQDNGSGACNLYWGALQKTGGLIAGKSSVTVELDKAYELTGIVIVADPKRNDPDRPYQIEISENGQNWANLGGVQMDGHLLRLDLSKSKYRAKFARLIRDGPSVPSDFHGGMPVNAFFIYGREIRR